jgi:hypothetical protein
MEASKVFTSFHSNSNGVNKMPDTKPGPSILGLGEFEVSLGYKKQNKTKQNKNDRLFDYCLLNLKTV